MDIDKLLIQQEKHYETLMKSLHTFSKSNVLTDCSLIAGHHQVALHRQVLSLVTSYFEELLQGRTVQDLCFIILNDCDESIFEKISEFLYSGTVVIDKSDSTEFHRVVKLLNINNFQSVSLTKKCEEIFTFLNFQELFINSFWCSRPTLKENHMIFVTKDWIETSAHLLVMCANSKYILNICMNQKRGKEPITCLLDNVEKRHLDKVIEFCYKGSVLLEQEIITDVYKLARLLGVEELLKKLHALDPLVQLPSKHGLTEIVSTIKTYGSKEGLGSNKIFRYIIESEHLVDISILSENISLSAHLAVLGEFSPYFQGLIKNCKVVKNSFLLINDLDKKQVQSFVEYVYKGETEFHGSTEDFRSIMKNWIDFDLLPISEAKECQLLSPKISEKVPCTSKSRRTSEMLLQTSEQTSSTFASSMPADDLTAITRAFVHTAAFMISPTNKYVNMPKTEQVQDDLKEEVGECSGDEATEAEPLECKSPRTLPRSISRVCNTCGLDLKTRAAFRAHLSIHPSARIIACKYCGKGFDRPSQMALHERTHTGSRPYQCHVCGKGFSAKSSMAKHLTTHGDDKFLCDICNKGFTRKQYIEEHLRTHSGSKPYKCTKCPMTFVGRTGLNHHQKTHDGMKGAVCEVCGKSFTRHGLWTHMKSHDKTYECPTCHKYYSTSTSLRIHNLGAHLGHRGHQCHACGKSFVQRNHLVRHMKVHQKEENVMYKCVRCPKTYKSDLKLQAHAEADHQDGDGRRYSCSICHKKFAGRSTVIYHQRTHTGERPHACHVCGKLFTRPDALRTHVLTHQERQPLHCCLDCNESFPTKTGLKKHRDLHHSTTLDPALEQKPEMKCAVCNKTFKSQKKLLTHVASHSLKKFPCNVCSKEFRCEANLSKHRFNIHSIPLPIPRELPPMYSFQGCGTSYKTVATHAVRRPYSINIDGNLCSNTVESGMQLQQATTVPLMEVTMCDLLPHHTGSR